MSDIVIPGISTNRNLDTDKMVEDLMKIERMPVERLESQVEEDEQKKQTWQSLGRTLSTLRDTSRSLYGFESPFRARMASSSNESVVSATASRQAQEGTTEVEVLAIAGRDRFASSPVAKDYSVPAGTYRFRVGEEESSIRFAGGSLQDFSQLVNRRAGSLVRTTIVPDTSDTRVLVFESQLEGAENALYFEEDARSLAVSMGVIAESSDRQVTAIGSEPVVLQPGESASFPLDRQFPTDQGMQVSFEARVVDLEREEVVPPPTPTGPTTPEPGSVTFKGVTVRNEDAPLDLPSPDPVEPPPFVEDNSVVSALADGTSHSLPDLVPGGEFKTIQTDARSIGRNIEGFVLDNKNTNRVVEIKNLRIADPGVRGDTVAQNPIDTARDARLRFSGIEITRPSNTVDDLIPGVTLSLLRPADESVEVVVSPDAETTKNDIIEFVGYYNQVIRDINIYTRTDQQLIDEIEYFSDDERDRYQERLGLFQGDSSLNQLKSRLQTIMMNPYSTDAGPRLQLLAQIGISTNASGSGSGYNVSRLRGYLEIDEDRLDTALTTDYDAISELFGRDTDGDLIVDSGVAFAVEQFSTPYVQTGGIVANRTTSLDTRINQAQDRIVRYNDRLTDTEARYRSEFGRMEGAMQQMQDNANAFDNLNNQNNQ